MAPLQSSTKAAMVKANIVPDRFCDEGCIV